MGDLRPKDNGARCQRIKIWLYKAYKCYAKVYVVYLMLIACGGAAVITIHEMPIYPISYYTLGWLLAFIYPLVAASFILASINVRYEEIIARFSMDKLWMVYYPGTDNEKEYKFSKFLWNRVGDYYNLLEFMIFSLLAGTLTFVLYLLIAAQFKIPEPPKTAVLWNLTLWTLEGGKWAVIAGSSFLGSLSGTIVFILRRYRMCDLRPIVFLQTTIALIAGTCAGAFITIVYPHPSLAVLSFIVGFLSAMNIDFLPNLMRVEFAKLTGSKLPAEIESDLSLVIKNTEAIESFNAISIYSIRELANADPIRLYLNMPQQIEMINVMVDQAMLHFYFPAYVEELGMNNVHRFTQLILALKPEFKEGSINWPQSVTVLDNGGLKDALLMRTVTSILDTRIHHKVLGLFLEKYRKAFFSFE